MESAQGALSLYQRLQHKMDQTTGREMRERLKGSNLMHKIML